jgi:MSHA biogenesis protein MshK
MARCLMRFAVLPLLFALPCLAHAQNADPTRPAIDTSAGADLSADSAMTTSSGLQSVILRKSGKPAALINGVVVELGGKVGEARLVKVGEEHVVLRGPLGDETLRLMPAAEKKTVKMEKTSGNTGMKGKQKKSEVAP